MDWIKTRMSGKDPSTRINGADSMADWDDGYVTDVPYTTSYHFETSPVWVATAALLNGVIPPDLSIPFRHADLGCGNGVTSLVSAATMPHGEFWAFDFNPAHVEAGRDIARRAGLTNIHFEEASFDGLAALPPNALPKFDYIASHGVLSWISRQNQDRLFEVIGQRLAPGGIVYLSYNVSTGWVPMPPVRTLMRLLIEASPDRTDLAAGAAFAILEKMKEAGATMFQAHPALSARLAQTKGQNPSYLAHEYLNRDWHPVMFQSVSTAMTAAKCEYIGSAALLDNLTGFTVPQPLREMFDGLRDLRQRETIRDIACGAGFRRDLYQRGARRGASLEHRRRIDAIGLARKNRALPAAMTVTAPLGQQSIDNTEYRALLDALAPGPMTIGALREHPALTNLAEGSLLGSVAVLLSGGLLAPLFPGSPSADAVALAGRLNEVHATLFEHGWDLPYIACPGLGAAMTADALTVMALESLRSGLAMDEASLVEDVLSRLARAGRVVGREGKPVTDPIQAREAATDTMRLFLRDHLPIYRGLGVEHGAPWADSLTAPPVVTET